MNIGKYILYNLDRRNSCALGGEPSEYDFCQVYENNKLVYFGILKECYEWIKNQVKFEEV